MAVDSVVDMSALPRSWIQLRVAAGVYRFRESLFALPALVVVAGAVLAEVSGYIDRAFGPFPWGMKMNSNAAIWLLSTVRVPRSPPPVSSSR